MKTKHPNNVEPSELKGYQCGLCHETFDGPADIEFHNTLKHENNTYKCYKCPFESVKASEVQIHHNETHLRNFLCKSCDYEDIDEEKVRNHIKTEH